MSRPEVVNLQHIRLLTIETCHAYCILEMTYTPKPTVNADWTNLLQLYGTVFLKTFDMCNQLAFSRNF